MAERPSPPAPASTVDAAGAPPSSRESRDRESERRPRVNGDDNPGERESTLRPGTGGGSRGERESEPGPRAGEGDASAGESSRRPRGGEGDAGGRRSHAGSGGEPDADGRRSHAGSGGEAGAGESTHRSGDVIAGKYRLERLLGEGGMGSVWRAHNEALDMAVAIKVIRHRAGTEEAERRLLQEARAAAKLEHPSIVRVFDFGESELGEPFIVMELLYGESLGEHLARAGRLSATEAVRLALPVAAGLAAAHAKGVVHRDLKPDNVVLVARDDGVLSPKIVDFGIAKLASDEFAGTLTALGTVLGSPDYMSPEQAKGESDVDARSDLWSLAVVLYELMTGIRPFLGPNYNALLTAIMLREPAPITDVAAGDEQLWAILRRAFEKEPARRWPSVREFGQALAAWAAEHGVTTDVTGASLAAHWGPAEPTPDQPLSLDLVGASASGRRGPPTVDLPPPGRRGRRRRRRRAALWLPLSLAATAAALAFGRAPAERLWPALYARVPFAERLAAMPPTGPTLAPRDPSAVAAGAEPAAPARPFAAPARSAPNAGWPAVPASASASSARSSSPPATTAAASALAAAAARPPAPPRPSARGVPPKASGPAPLFSAAPAPVPEPPSPESLPIPDDPNFLRRPCPRPSARRRRTGPDAPRPDVRGPRRRAARSR